MNWSGLIYIWRSNSVSTVIVAAKAGSTSFFQTISSNLSGTPADLNNTLSPDVASASSEIFWEILNGSVETHCSVCRCLVWLMGSFQEELPILLLDTSTSKSKKGNRNHWIYQINANIINTNNIIEYNDYLLSTLVICWLPIYWLLQD